MFIIKRIHVPYESVGLVFREGRFVELLEAGRFWRFDPLWRTQVEVSDLNEPWLMLQNNQLKQLREAEAVAERAEFVDLNDNQRALVWLDGRFHGILTPGLYAYWKGLVKVRIEVVNVREGVRFEHAEAEVILKNSVSNLYLDVHDIEDGKLGVLYLNGQFAEILRPGRYAFWKNAGKVKLYQYDLREKVLDVSGQEIMTADKVTLRLNAVLTYRIADVRKVAETAEDAAQALYREVQLVIRAEVGGRTLDALLGDKTAVAREAFAAMKEKATTYGLEVLGLGIRDIILPGDMKELLNQVIEAEKAAQANNIKRREETAAMRSQLNTAKLIEQNPALMRLRELEAVEKITEKANLQIFVGDGQELSKRIVKLI